MTTHGEAKKKNPRVFKFSTRYRQWTVSPSGRFNPEDPTVIHWIGGWAGIGASVYVMKTKIPVLVRNRTPVILAVRTELSHIADSSEKNITIFMEQSSSSGADSRSGGEEIPVCEYIQ
jgi:hypothetical protein